MCILSGEKDSSMFLIFMALLSKNNLFYGLTNLFFHFSIRICFFFGENGADLYFSCVFILEDDLWLFQFYLFICLLGQFDPFTTGWNFTIINATKMSHKVQVAKMFRIYVKCVVNIIFLLPFTPFVCFCQCGLLFVGFLLFFFWYF